MKSLVIGISGTHGSGKSTLLNALARNGIPVDDFKVSRAVQKQLGWDSLDNVMSSAATMMEFQNAVFDQKYKNDLKLRDSSNLVILTERTFADIYAYTALWTWKLVDEQKLTIEAALQFMLKYLRRCRDAQAEVYNGVLVLDKMSHLPSENDPHRAKETDSKRLFDNLVSFQNALEMPSHRITGITVDQRVDESMNFLSTLVSRSQGNK